MDSAPACPFVAFEDDRESRASSPDHRHRCYAEQVPSPRAAAHQEAYCLSSAFPVCPTFQDWARREAAHTSSGGGSSRTAGGPRQDDRSISGAQGPARASGDEREAASEWGGYPRHEEPAAPEPVQRNPPRDWAAPPPWATGASAASAGSRRSAAAGGETQRGPAEAAGPDGDGTPGFLAARDAESRGLAGSAADRLASGLPGGAHAERPLASPPDEELAGLVAPRYPEPARRVEPPRHGELARPAEPKRERDYLPPSRGARRPAVSSTRHGNREHDRDSIAGPSWERARRFEAYPSLRARTGLSAPPRLALLAGALVVAAVGLFFLPALIGVGGGGGGPEGTATPSTSASAGVASPSVAPSEPAAPSQQVYVIKSGDTLSKVATDFGLTLEELLAANPTIENPDRIAIGDEIVIPARAPEEFSDPSTSPS